MTYRAPAPIGLDDHSWTEELSAQKAFTEAATALTDSVLAIDMAISLIDDVDAEALLRVFRERRQQSQRKLTELGLSDGFRADDVDPTGTEELRRAWMDLKSKITDSQSTLKVLVHEEQNSIDKLAGARNRGLPSTIEDVLGSAIIEMEHNIGLLDAEGLSPS